MTLIGLLSLLFGCKRDSPYQQRGATWYYKDDAMRVAPGVSVTPLSRDFATAGDDAFFRATPIGGADGRSFEALSEHYAKDSRSVYYADTYRDGREYFSIKHLRVRVISGADAASFRYLGHHYASDSTGAYIAGERFDVADVASFEPLGYGYARDRVTGYFGRVPIPGSDGRTFVAIDDHHAKDAKHVFYSRTELNGGVGPAVVKHVRLIDAQPSSFTPLDEGYAADSTHAYFKGALLRDVTLPLEVLRLGYARSGARVLYEGRKLDGADAATFATLDSKTTADADAADARARYREGRRVQGSPARAP